MSRRHPPESRPRVVFDDRVHSASIGTLATAFCVGGALTLLAFNTARTARSARLAGPADGAPRMRAPLQVGAPGGQQRDVGQWHAQARRPNRFEKRCTGPVTAEYTLMEDGSGLQVLNRCILPDGRFEESAGVARVAPVAGQPGAGRLEVCFAPEWLRWLPMVWGDYWILRLDRDYQVALVGTPDRKCLWVLSRAPRLEDAALQAELDYARSLGFEVDKVERTGR